MRRFRNGGAATTCAKKICAKTICAETIYAKTICNKCEWRVANAARPAADCSTLRDGPSVKAVDWVVHPTPPGKRLSQKAESRRQ
jgi:hypothetical protein